ncbi:MAG: hypothetical protein ACLTDR_13395 [Adlercreutzia equolifaciens]
MEARLRPGHDQPLAAVQVLVYFLVPLGLAVCHSACAIGVLVRFPCWTPIGVSSAGPITMAAALTLVIYGGYMLVTYLAAAAS